MELNRLFYLLMLLVLIPSAQAQIYRRTADGGDSVQTNIFFTTDKLHNMQHQIQYKMGDSTYE